MRGLAIGIALSCVAGACTCFTPVYDCSTCPGDCDPVQGCLTFDAGRDAGSPPRRDAGIDAGLPRDAGADAGVRDAGLDGGSVRDAGLPDAGVSDAGLDGGFVPDAGRDGCAPDAGFVLDAGPGFCIFYDAGARTDAGACVVQPVDLIRTGHAVMLGDSVLYQAEDGGVIFWRGSGGTFTERDHIGDSAAAGGLLAPRLRRAADATLLAAWRTDVAGGRLVYAQRTGSCGWEQVDLTPRLPNGPWGPGVGLATYGAQRAMAAKNGAPPMGGAFYFECTANCGVASSWGSVIIGPTYSNAFGIDVEIADAGPLVPWTTVIIGGDSLSNPSAMLWRHCTGMCLSPSAWQNGVLPPGVFPDLVIDAQGLPRVFYLTRSPGGALAITRCVAPPCHGPMASVWQTTMLLPAADSVSAGALPDGRTWFVAGNAGSVLYGVETPAGYDVGNVTTCSGASLAGAWAATDPSASVQRWVVPRDGGLWVE